MLALRGLLAHGILFHCLQLRHHVNYGVCPGGPRRMAVPFQASNTPSPRAEFRHPDCLLVYTVLSYYQTGLSDNQVAEAVKVLLVLCARGPLQSGGGGVGGPYISADSHKTCTFL